MKNYKILNLIEKIFAILIIIFIVFVIVGGSIINIQEKGFKSYGTLILGVIVFIILLWLSAYLIRKLFPKLKFGESFIRAAKNLLGELINALSLSG